jgi:hypothetical protein
LLRRFFGDQVTQCPRCGDRLRGLAFITDPVVTGRILDHLGIAFEQVVVAPRGPALAKPSPRSISAADCPPPPPRCRSEGCALRSG